MGFVFHSNLLPQVITLLMSLPLTIRSRCGSQFATAGVKDLMLDTGDEDASLHNNFVNLSSPSLFSFLQFFLPSIFASHFYLYFNHSHVSQHLLFWMLNCFPPPPVPPYCRCSSQLILHLREVRHWPRVKGSRIRTYYTEPGCSFLEDFLEHYWDGGSIRK